MSKRRTPQAPEESLPQQGSPVAGAPSWITEELIQRTLKTWQPYYRTPLTREDALAMLHNVASLFKFLGNGVLL